MAAKKTRTRDASTGKIVSSADAAARPNETVTEDASKVPLEKRVSKLEALARANGWSGV